MGVKGSKKSKIITINQDIYPLSSNSFEFKFVIGRGGFGKVWQVKMKQNNKYFALKEMSKVKIIDKHSEENIKGERILLSKLHHPFIVNMHYAFQDYENLYLVMDLLNGGDLRYHLSKNKNFTEEQTSNLLHINFFQKF